MSITNSPNIVQYWKTKQVPETVECGDRTYVPTRLLYSRLGYMHSSTFKYMCIWRFGIPIIRPYGIKNIPCIDQVFVSPLLDMYNAGLIDIEGNLSYARLRQLGYPEYNSYRNEIREDVRHILEQINFDPNSPDFEVVKSL